MLETQGATSGCGCAVEASRDLKPKLGFPSHSHFSYRAHRIDCCPRQDRTEQVDAMRSGVRAVLDNVASSTPVGKASVVAKLVFAASEQCFSDLRTTLAPRHLKPGSATQTMPIKGDLLDISC